MFTQLSRFGMTSLAFLALLCSSLLLLGSTTTSRTAHAATAATTRGYTCQAAPRVVAPPTPVHLVEAAATADPVSLCPAGQVPQPTNLMAAKYSPGKQSAITSLDGVDKAHYAYVSMHDEQTGAGAVGYFSQHSPYPHPSDGVGRHTLAELAAGDADFKQIVEIGWSVDPGLYNGSLTPHLFVYHWVNGVGTCYNGCGYLQWDGTYYPGVSVATYQTNAHTFQYAVLYFNGNWWLEYDHHWIGYFPGSVWSGISFDHAERAQWFGEVYSASTDGHFYSQMGNGITGTNSRAALVTSMGWLDANQNVRPARADLVTEHPPCYVGGNYSSGDQFTYGGFCNGQ